MKGQIWSIDFAVSVVIFVGTLVSFLFTFNLISTDAAKQSDLSLMQDLSLEATESLIRTRGIPPYWTNITVQVIGLAVEENVLNGSKLLHFMNIDYNQSKVLLSIGNYEYYFSLEHPNGTVVTFQGTALSKGQNYTNATTIVLTERYVVFSGINKVKFILWN